MNAFAGTGTLFRFALRRDRVMLPAWVYALTAATASTAVSFEKLYPDAGSRERLAASLAGDSSLRALYGPLHDATTIGGITAWRMGVFGAALAGLMSILLVVRHTRAEEEDGRLELVRAGAVGHRAPLTAALLTAALADLLLAALVTAALVLLGQGAAGSAAFGLALAACGLVFAAVAAVTAQLAGTGRAANGSACAVLGLAYALRAAGDSAGGGLSLLSPIGWSERVEPFAADRWWVPALAAAFAALLTAAAYALLARRDLGAGLFPSRPGRATGVPALRTPLALAWRLQRGTLYGWCAGFAVGGAVFGGVAKGVLDLVRGNSGVADVLRRIGGRDAVLDAYLSTVLGLLGMLAAVYAVQSVLRLRGEETGGRAEPVLGTAVSRLRWAAGHLLFPLLGSALVLAVGGLAAGLAEAAATGGSSAAAAARLLGAALVQLPAVWLTAAAATALFGLAPGWTPAAWGVLAVFLLIGWLGPVLRFGRWLLDLSPFTHLPHLPGGAFDAEPLLWLTLLAAALTAAGLAGLRRRDLG
ncbi:exporter of polyketide antibiotics [Kitasatospora kazusensis]|uniref:Exporter of polyketide antibiotics n=1 Tax=Kitasatospora kazusensis TaxID=407974 RepID=A0ABN3A0L8_9ACTN